jgi:hypothetical protein
MLLLLASRFLVELVGVASLAYVGAVMPGEVPLRIALGIGLPLALIALWALVVAPQAANPIPRRVRELIGTALLVLVAGSLAVAGQPGWGTALAAVVVADQALLLLLGTGHGAASLAHIAGQEGL